MKPNTEHHIQRTLAIAISVLTIYLLLHYNYVAWEQYPAPVSQMLLHALQNMYLQPLNAIRFGSMYWTSTAFIILFIGIMMDLLLYAEWIRERNRHAGKEKGTAKWGSIKKFSKKYAYGIAELSTNKAIRACRKFKGLAIPLRLIAFIILRNHYYVRDGIILKWKQAKAELRAEKEGITYESD